MKNSYLTVTDQFCGAGGSSQGARKAGLEVKIALNHWKLAIETHNTNFPETLHDCTDISACDPRRYPSTHILLTSPECTTHSPAGGNRHKTVKATMDMFDKEIIDPSTERSRATMWDVCRFTEYHNYEIVIVENVVEARTRWVLFDVWLQAMHRLGYDHKCLYLNSMHFWPTPQSRDRMYVVFWKKGNKAPELDHRPIAHCPQCVKDVNAIQTWKNPAKKFGKYRFQYLYSCPVHGTVVEPYYYAAFNAIDWSDLGTRIGDRKKSLSPNTLKRIQWGLDRYGMDPLIVNTKFGKEARGVTRPASREMMSQTTISSTALATPFVIKGEHSSLPGYAKKVGDAFMTQTVRQTSALVTPWIIEEAKPATDAMPSQTSVINNGIVSHESWSSFLQYYYGNHQASKLNEPIGTVNTRDRSYLVNYQKPEIEDCFYRMIKAPEVKASMAFDSDYIILGSQKDQVKQCGNAVTPPVQEWIIKQCADSLE
jgi:DNA (cytosine-5)-methyltransferase 1